MQGSLQHAHEVNLCKPIHWFFIWRRAENYRCIHIHCQF